MNRTFFKYSLISIAILAIWSYILIVSLNNPSFDDKHWSLTANGFLFTILIFIVGIFLLPFRLPKTNLFYYGVGLFNFLTSISLAIQWKEEISFVALGIILLPFTVGLFILTDIFYKRKRSL